MKVDTLRCSDPRPCFAREVNPEGTGICMILRDTYLNENKNCPFCKPEKEVTDGKRYPYDVNYSMKMQGKKANDDKRMAAGA